MKSSLAALLHAFFHEWMGSQRNLSRHTVCSYRDTWKLLLRFVSERRRREIAELSLADLHAGEVLAFLEHLERDRKASIGTRNCRLAAIHSFFGLVAHREPLAQWHDIIADPTLGDAILDRIVHNAHRIQLKDDSLRRCAGERKKA